MTSFLFAVKANWSEEVLTSSNPKFFKRSLISYLRLLIFRLDAGEPSKKSSLNTVLSSVNEISCVGALRR